MVLAAFRVFSGQASHGICNFQLVPVELRPNRIHHPMRKARPTRFMGDEQVRKERGAFHEVRGPKGCDHRGRGPSTDLVPTAIPRPYGRAHPSRGARSRLGLPFQGVAVVGGSGSAGGARGDDGSRPSAWDAARAPLPAGLALNPRPRDIPTKLRRQATVRWRADGGYEALVGLRRSFVGILELANSLRSSQVSPPHFRCLLPFHRSRILMSEARGMTDGWGIDAR